MYLGEGAVTAELAFWHPYDRGFREYVGGGMRQVGIADLMAQSGVGFGTSGARGRVEDMTPEVCYAYT